MVIIAPMDELHSPAMWADPYPIYARLRRDAPAYFDATWNVWLVTRYADVAAGLRDARLSAARGKAMGARFEPPLGDNLAWWTTFIDPPDHTRVRSLINRAFTSRVVERLRPAIVELTRLLLDDAAGSELDVIAQLAAPLPVTVIGDLLGFPRADRHLLKGWSDAIAVFFGSLRPAPSAIAGARAAVGELEAYLRDAIAARLRSPGDDLLSSLIAARDQGGKLDDRELLSTCTTVLFGGYETTTNLIGNGLHHLLAHRAALARLREHPDAMPDAVEELLRFDSPVQYIGRLAGVDLEIAGTAIARGAQVFLVTAAANRDPAVFGDPDVLVF